MKIFQKIISVMYLPLALLQSAVFIIQGINSMFTINGINVDHSMTLESLIWFMFALSIITPAILLPVIAFKKQKMQRTSVFCAVGLCVNNVLICLLPSQTYAVSWYMLFRPLVIVNQNFFQYLSFIFSSKTFLFVTAIAAIVMIVTVVLNNKKQETMQ